MPRSTRSSSPSVSALRHVEGSSRSSPRSSAKWLRVPALITRKGRPCSAAMPATSAWVPSPPATPSRSAPSATAWRARAATSTVPGPCSSATWAPSCSALSFSPNLVTFPPPDLGFMIRNGRRGRAAGRAGMAASGPPVLSAALAVPAASTISATATMATHSRLARVNATRMSTGAATTRASAIHRRTPRLARNQYPPARTAHTPIAANAISVRLCHPATASTSATAASIRANEARASQRRVIVVIRCHPQGSASCRQA